MDLSDSASRTAASNKSETPLPLEPQIPIFIMANDAVLPEMVRLLASVRRHEPEVDVHFVPFNDDTKLSRRVAEIFDCKIFEEDLSEFDAFGHEVCDDDPPQQPYPYMLGKFRKLAVFRREAPAIYIDLDTILVSPLFTRVKKALDTPFDLAFVSWSKQWIYEDNEEARPFLERTTGFSTGFLMVKPTKFNFELIKDTIRSNLALYRRIRKAGVLDQPLLNFVADFNNLKIQSLPNLLDFSAHTVATSDLVSFKVRVEADGAMIQVWQGAERPVGFLHAAGKYKHHDEYDYLFKANLYDGLVHVFRKDADLGTKLLTIIDAWRP